jgi:hypothetical protein
MELLGKGMSLVTAAAKADMDEKTARKYRSLGKLPQELRVDHFWRTREDPFDDFWAGVEENLGINPGLEAKTLFEDLQRRYPGRFGDGQLRTLQRRVKIWRALQGPPREVFFPQVHKPGELCESDFTSMNSLGVSIQRQHFEHLLDLPKLLLLVTFPTPHTLDQSDRLGLVGSMDPVECLAEIKRARTHRVARPARHEARDE